MESNEMFLLLLVFVSGRFRRPDEAFLCIRMRDGWLV